MGVYTVVMRVEPYTVNSIVHVIKRGTRGLPIVREEVDRRRFVQLLYYSNDTYRDEFWEQSVKGLDFLGRPEMWPEQKPLVHVVAWTLLPNHFHLVLKALDNGSVAKFMQRLCGSMATHYNAKYDERGSLFQGAYRSRTAEMQGGDYLRTLAIYVMVKNVFEMYKGGLRRALENFDNAYEWAIRYPYSSLSHYAGKPATSSKFLTTDIFSELFESPREFKAFARESMRDRLEQMNELEAQEWGVPGRPKKQLRLV